MRTFRPRRFKAVRPATPSPAAVSPAKPAAVQVVKAARPEKPVVVSAPVKTEAPEVQPQIEIKPKAEAKPAAEKTYSDEEILASVKIRRQPSANPLLQKSPAVGQQETRRGQAGRQKGKPSRATPPIKRACG